MRWEGAPGTEFFRHATWALIDDQPAWAINRAGAPADPPIFVLSVTVPAGAMSDRRKAGLVEEATRLVLDAEDRDRDLQRVWVHLHEIPDGRDDRAKRGRHHGMTTSLRCAAVVFMRCAARLRRCDRAVWGPRGR
jgi:hypothetical protein